MVNNSVIFYTQFSLIDKPLGGMKTQSFGGVAWLVDYTQ